MVDACRGEWSAEGHLRRMFDLYYKKQSRQNECVNYKSNKRPAVFVCVRGGDTGAVHRVGGTGRYVYRVFWQLQNVLQPRRI